MMEYNDVENRYLNRMANADFPGIEPAPEPAGTVRPGAMQGEMRAIPQTQLERSVGTLGESLQSAGQLIDQYAPGSLNDFLKLLRINKDVPGIGELRLRDVIPFVGGTEQVEGPDGRMITKEVGTPQALQMFGRGESLTTGTGFTTEMKPDVKAAALDVGLTAAPFAKQAGQAVVKAVKATEGLPVGMSTKAVGGTIEQAIMPQAAMPNVVSTRLPTAVKATEDPMTGELLSDIGTMKRDPAAFEQNISLVREYPNFVSKARNTDKRADDFIEHVKDNLLYLYDQVPEATRNRSRLWYDGARNIVNRWGTEFNQPDQALAGVLAVLSPQKDWFMNVSLGNRVVDIALNKRGFQWDSAMDDMATNIWKDPKYDPVLALVRGKRYEDLQSPAEKALWLRTYDQAFNPPDHRIVTPEGDFADVRLTQSGKPYRVAWGSLNEIGKAVSILDNPSLENISTMLGSQHKVRNFYNNIYAPGDPRGHVTIDTHAVAAGLLRPLSGNSKEVLHNFGSGIKGERGPANSSVSGAQGTYGIYAEAYRRAAAERGVLPREMQSITWEAVRGLFPDTFKTPKNAQLIDNIWLQYRKGKLSLEEARDAVIKSAGGINPPEWESGLRGAAATEGGAAINAGELPGSSVSGGSSGGPGRNKPATGNSSTVKRGQAPIMGAE